MQLRNLLSNIKLLDKKCLCLFTPISERLYSSQQGPTENTNSTNLKFNNDPQKTLEEEIIQKGNKDVSKIIMDKESIEKKLKDKRETKLPLDYYEIKPQGQYYDGKNKQNPTSGIFNFNEDFLMKKSQLEVHGLANGFFSVNDVWYPGSIVLFPRQVFLWDVQTASDIRSHSFDLIEFIKPTPNYVIIGTGRERFDLADSYFKRLKEMGIKVDVLPTFEACSTFNVCNEDLLNICAFLIPSNLQQKWHIFLGFCFLPLRNCIMAYVFFLGSFFTFNKVMIVHWLMDIH